MIHTSHSLHNVPKHFINNREIPHCLWGWTGSRPHSYFYFGRLDLLPFLLFLPLKERACTHTDLILSYYLPAVRLKCQALKCVFLNISSSNIWIYATLILAGFLLFLFSLPGTCECPVHTQWHQTIVEIWFFGIMSND